MPTPTTPTTAPESAPKEPEKAAASKPSTAELARATMFAKLGRDVKLLGEKVDGITDFIPRSFDMVKGKMEALEDDSKWVRTVLFKGKADVEEMEEMNKKFIERYERLEQKNKQMEEKMKNMEEKMEKMEMMEEKLQKVEEMEEKLQKMEEKYETMLEKVKKNEEWIEGVRNL
jgi:DNA repair ATPase RecN